MFFHQCAMPRAAAGAGAFAGRLACLTGLLLIAGCSAGAKLPTVPASGTVTYKGQALEGATVTFLPQSKDESAKGASAQTDSQGRFSMQTYLGGGSQTSPGALPGDYFVTVTKAENQAEGIRGPEVAGKMAEMQRQAAQGGGPPGRPGGGGATARAQQSFQPKSLIPDKYSDAQKSGFTAKIGASGNNDLKFDLTE
jgi:hypothetical protein